MNYLVFYTEGYSKSKAGIAIANRNIENQMHAKSQHALCIKPQNFIVIVEVCFLHCVFFTLSV